MMELKNIVGGYSKESIIKGIDLKIKKGEFFVLLGPNGSGKTTLFKLITGQLPLQKGTIEVEGKELGKLSKLEKAKKVAVLAQEGHVSFDYTVEEIVSLGRYPHQKGIFKRLTRSDWDVIEQVMEISKIGHLRHAKFRTISGGEKQRVLLAKALAQEPSVLLLDEPTNHLDIKHTFQMLNQLKNWQQTKGLTVFAILHDLNIASLYADRVALLHEGAFLEIGDVNTLRKEGRLKKVYEVDVKTQSHPTVPKPQLLMTPTHSLNSDKQEFKQIYRIMEKECIVSIQFSESMRTISNGVIGNGYEWLRYYSLFNEVEESAENESLLKEKMNKWEIPIEQAMSTVTIGTEKRVIIEKEIEGINCLFVVIVEHQSQGNIGAIHTMVFIDHYICDEMLLNGFMRATEVKVKATVKLHRNDSARSRDSLVFACRQTKKQMEKDTWKLVKESIGRTLENLIKDGLIHEMKETKTIF